MSLVRKLSRLEGKGDEADAITILCESCRMFTTIDSRA